MILTIIKKEVLENLLNQRFLICTVAAVVMMLGTGLVNSHNFVEKRANYQKHVTGHEAALREVTFYSALTRDEYHAGQFRAETPKAFRTPQPLELFAQGKERQLGQVVNVSPFIVPYQADEVDPFNSDNPYMLIFNSYDMIFIFQLVLGLLAILMASEAVSGEKEEGTLRLMLTTHVSRAQVLAGKLLGGGVILAIPTLLAFIILLILLIGTEGIELRIEDGLRIIILFFLSFFYLIIFYLLGLMVSCMTEYSVTSVLGGLFVWVLTVVVLPTGIRSMLNEMAHQESNKLITDRQYAQLWGELYRDVDNLVGEKDGDRYPPINMVETVPSNSVFRYSSIGGGEKGDFIYIKGDLVDSPALSRFLDILRSGEHLRLRFAQRVWNVRKPLLEDRPRRLTRLHTLIQRLSPAGAYAEVATIIARTDQEGFYRFLEQARDYREQIIVYLEDCDAFGQRAWFNDGDEQIDLQDMPRFMEKKETLAESLSRALPSLGVLVLYTCGLFTINVWLFERYEVL